MPSSSFSRTDSRRSDRPAATLLRAAVLAAALSATLAGAPCLGAQDLSLSVRTLPQTILASVSFQWNRQSELVSSLRDGLESRVVFTLRVYQKRQGFLPFPRDRLLSETVLARSAFWDFLDARFVVESDDGTRTVYADADDLLRGLFSVRDLPVYHGPGNVLPSCYVSARAHIEPVRLMPPLTIVSMAGVAGTAAAYTTPWQRKEVK